MKVLETYPVIISKHGEPNFDKVCEAAQSLAVIMAGIDDDGNSSKIKDWCRSTDSLKIDFISMSMEGGMSGWEYLYRFECSVIRCEDND